MGTEEQNQPPAGWYADPEGSAGQMRYWDGTRWTEHRHDAGVGAPAIDGEPRFRALRVIATVFFVLGCLTVVLGTLGVIAAAIDAGSSDETTTTIFGESVEEDETEPVVVVIVGTLFVLLYALFFFAASSFIRLMLSVEESTRRTAVAVETLRAGDRPG
jgi:hypothetical protein